MNRIKKASVALAVASGFSFGSDAFAGKFFKARSSRTYQYTRMSCNSSGCQKETEYQSATVNESTSSSGNDSSFCSWLNSIRSQHGLPPVSVDAGLNSCAASNNQHQMSRGLGHFFMGFARRQNSGLGNLSSVCNAWLASPSHRSALLDPSITVIGIDGRGNYWTFTAR